MDLHYLRIFYEVATEKSFTKAANKLFINQSAVSIQVKKFEDMLNTKLFDRTSKKIKLTYSGEVLYKVAEEIFQKVKRAEKEIEKIVLFDKAKITIGATHMIGEHLLPRIMKEFTKAHPEVEFDLVIREREILLRELKEGKIDMLLMGTYYIKDAELEVIDIANYPFVVVGRDKVEDIQRLPEQKLIMRDDSPLTIKNIALFEKKNEFTLDNRIMVRGSIETMKNLVKEGLGFTVLPYYCVSKEAENGSFQIIEDFNEDQDGYQIVVTKDRADNPESRKFVEYVKNNFKI